MGLNEDGIALSYLGIEGDQVPDSRDAGTSTSELIAVFMVSLASIGISNISTCMRVAFGLFGRDCR